MGRAQGAEDEGYSLPWPRSQRWNPSYNVPRNSVEHSLAAALNLRIEPMTAHTNLGVASIGSLSQTNTLVPDTQRAPPKKPKQGSPDNESHDLSNLSHWLETLSELYMNNLDNRARWDPRWLNITHRERYGGLSSAAVTVLDYLKGQDTATEHTALTKEHMAALLQDRPENCDLRIVLVTDLSRFTMGAIGQLYSIDPEFWFEHLTNAGYAASDSQLKACNAIWMNWSEQETRFRHRPLPGTGQRTEWNVPRRQKNRSWTHMRWARLGLMHYLGKKGFNEAEIEVRLSDGRWMMERDVVLDKWGRYMTAQKLSKAKTLAKEKKEKKQKMQAKRRKNMLPPGPSPTTEEDLTTPTKVKASNIYRPYSTFEGLPKNINSWFNRDLRVMAPEGLSYWSGQDETGQRVGEYLSSLSAHGSTADVMFKTVVLALDPARRMKNIQTAEYTPSLTFMPRPLEVEGYTDEELWRIADAEETYLDPPPPPITNKEIKKQKRESAKQNLKQKRDSLRNRFRRKKANFDVPALEESGESQQSDSESSYTSDDDYDEDYENELREEYQNPKPYSRDRAFARKYSLSTRDLVLRHLRKRPTAAAEDEGAFITALLHGIVLDDFWRLLSEFRKELEQLDGDFSGVLFTQLVESIGNSVRQNVSWIRGSLQEMNEWSKHLQSTAKSMSASTEILEEFEMLTRDVQAMQARTESTLSMLASSMGLSQSSLVIDQTSGINKLTELAFFFIPLSFITSVFSMQVLELTAAPPRIWTWGLALGLVFLATYLIRILLRSPSVRIGVLHCRATIINRFSSSKASSAERRLNTVGNRAVAKFIIFFFAMVVVMLVAMVAAIMVLVMALFGIWLCVVATALYFIITRWPDPAVLAPCFISLPLAAVGLCVSWLWSDEIYEWAEKTMMWMFNIVIERFPEKWRLDSVDDDDLSREGVNTYARQALLLST